MLPLSLFLGAPKSRHDDRQQSLRNLPVSLRSEMNTVGLQKQAAPLVHRRNDKECNSPSSQLRLDSRNVGGAVDARALVICWGLIQNDEIGPVLDRLIQAAQHVGSRIAFTPALMTLTSNPRALKRPSNWAGQAASMPTPLPAVLLAPRATTVNAWAAED